MFCMICFWNESVLKILELIKVQLHGCIILVNDGCYVAVHILMYISKITVTIHLLVFQVACMLHDGTCVI